MPDWSKRNARALLKEFQRHGQATDVHIRDFRGENLQGEVFDKDEDLAGADFRQADLTDVRFPRGVDLTGADLSESLLVGAVLDGADLSGADLRGAVLDRASLIGADLAGARVEDAAWHRTRLIGAVVPRLTRAASWGAALPGMSPRLEIARSAAVQDLAVRPQNDLLAMARSDRVEIWDLAANTPIGAPFAHPGGVTAVAWSPDGEWLASTGGDACCRIWAVGTGTLLHELRGGGSSGGGLAWSPEGSLIAAVDDAGAYVWNAADGRLTLRLAGGSRAVAWSPEGDVLATGDTDREIRLWTATSDEPVFTFRGHRGDISALAWSPDGERLASCADDGNVFVWNRWGGLIESLPHPQAMAEVAWSPDGARIAGAGRDGGAWIWDPETRRLLNTLPRQGDGVNAIAWSPDGQWLIKGGEDGAAQIWNAAATAPLSTLSGPDRQVSALAWSPDGTRLASATPDEVRLWDPVDGVLAGAWPFAGRYAATLVWSPDGTRLASSGDDVRLWDAATGKPRGSVGVPADTRALAWSPDGTTLACGGFGQVCLWDFRRSAVRRTLAADGARVSAAAWSPDGATLACADQGGALIVWDVPGAGQLGAFDCPPDLQALAWSPDGRRLTGAAGSGKLLIWDVSALAPAPARSRAWYQRRPAVPDLGPLPDAVELAPPGAIDRIAISPDSRRVAMVLEDDCVVVATAGEPGREPLRLLALPHGGWAAFLGDHTYRLHGDPAGRFWWSAGLCRFEPGDLDANGVARLG